ncbi:MAG: DUF2958 domain-containing protein [Caedimonas sp.]|nr:DUF2958 domain-containing protein [Caedimonas sp.]
MKLISQKDYKKLLANGKRQRQAQEQGKGLDFKPVVRLFTPDAQATWLLTEIDPEAPLIAFGLCDLGMGYSELGYVSLEEISSMRGRLGLPVERDLYFVADKTLGAYRREAEKKGRIIA